MKLQLNANLITKSETFTESNYSIEATAKAFSILSDSLYSNKIKAVIRELSTNAYDAHIAAGNAETPFYINLPTALDSQFWVRDYGTGLNKEDCMSLYTTYFRSNKTDSNEAVGCLGLGSKSPFAYTDQFMVESFYNGNHMTFSAYKNENDEPVFALLSEQETSEPNGLKVSFSTEARDRFDFLREAHDVLEYFVVVPDNNVELDVSGDTSGDAVMSGKDWKISNKHSYGDNIIIMGQIAYPLDEDRLEGEARTMLENCYGLVIYGNIGNVDITPSRESLSYNSRTKKFLHDKLSEIIQEITEQSQSYIDNCGTKWEARLTYINLLDRLRRVKPVVDAIEAVQTWNNEKLFDSGMNREIGLPETTKAEENVVHYSKSKWRSAVNREETLNLTVYSPKNMSIIYENEKKGSVGKVKHLLKETMKEGNVYLVRGDEVYLSKVLDCLGAKREDLTNVSTLDSPPKKQYYSGNGSSSGTKKCEVLECVDGEWSLTTCTVSVKEKDAYFLERIREDYYLNGDAMSAYYIRQILTALSNSGADMSDIGGKIYVFTPSTIKSMKLRSRSNWTDGSELLTTEVRYQLDVHKDEITSYEHSTKDEWSTGNYAPSTQSLKNVSKECETHGKLGEYLDRAMPEYDFDIKSLINAAGRVKIYRAFAENLEAPEVDINDMYDKMIEYYPMLRMATKHIQEEAEIKIVADYIDSINNSQGVI